MRRSFILCSTFFFFILLFSLNQFVAAEDNVRIYPEEDAYVKSTLPDENTGEYYDFDVINNTGQNVFFIAYLLFDIASVNEEILRMEFFICTTWVQATQNVSLSTNSNTSWSESLITYNKQPNGEKKFIGKQEIIGEYRWYNWSIPTEGFVNNRTSLVLNAEENEYLMHLRFASKENSENRKPYILLYFESEKVSGYVLLITFISITFVSVIINRKRKVW